MSKCRERTITVTEEDRLPLLETHWLAGPGQGWRARGGGGSVAQPAKGPRPSWLNLECFEVCHVVKPIREENNWKDPPLTEWKLRPPEGQRHTLNSPVSQWNPGPLLPSPGAVSTLPTPPRVSNVPPYALGCFFRT